MMFQAKVPIRTIQTRYNDSERILGALKNNFAVNELKGCKQLDSNENIIRNNFAIQPNHLKIIGKHVVPSDQRLGAVHLFLREKERDTHKERDREIIFLKEFKIIYLKFM